MIAYVLSVFNVIFHKFGLYMIIYVNSYMPFVILNILYDIFQFKQGPALYNLHSWMFWASSDVDHECLLSCAEGAR